MRCPRCEDSELQERARQGVMIDLCVSCRGVWLDRGELEKLMAQAERAAAEEEAYYTSRPVRERQDTPPRVPLDPRAAHQQQPSGYRDHDHDHKHKHGYGSGHPRKRKTFLDTLGDIFD